MILLVHGGADALRTHIDIAPYDIQIIHDYGKGAEDVFLAYTVWAGYVSRVDAMLYKLTYGDSIHTIDNDCIEDGLAKLLLAIYDDDDDERFAGYLVRKV